MPWGRLAAPPNPARTTCRRQSTDGAAAASLNDCAIAAERKALQVPPSIQRLLHCSRAVQRDAGVAGEAGGTHMRKGVGCGGKPTPQGIENSRGVRAGLQACHEIRPAGAVLEQNLVHNLRQQPPWQRWRSPRARELASQVFGGLRRRCDNISAPERCRPPCPAEDQSPRQRCRCAGKSSACLIS